MATFSYLNFDVQIQRAGETGYRVQVEAPSGEIIRAPFELPFSDLELENFMLKAGPSRRGVRRADTPETDAAKRFGEKLYAALFTADVRSALQSSLDDARQRGESGRQRVGVRLRLRLAEVPELASVPWEYLYNPSLNRFLALSTETPLVRYLDLPERVRPLKVVLPLRVLVMVAGPSDYARLDVRQEWLNLNTAVADLQEAGLVELILLETPTLTGLQRQLRHDDYHIFHFIGHGAFDRNAADGMLILEDEDGRGRPVSGQDLAMLLHDHTPLRLAVLNACEGGLSAADDPFAGVAQSLLQGGLPAVIAMQFEITDLAAIVIAHEFYRAVADGYPVDAALTEARKVVLTESRGSGLEWGTPVLYMRSPDGHLFTLQKPRPSPSPSIRPQQAAAELAQPPPAPPPPGPTADAPHANAPRASEAANGSTLDAWPAGAPAGQEVHSEPAALPLANVEPPKDLPPAAGMPGEPASQLIAPASAPGVVRGVEPSQTPGTQTPTRRAPNRRLMVVGLIVAVLALVAVGAFIALSGGGVAPLSALQGPADAEGHYNAGVTAWNANDYDKAMAELSEAIRLKPDYAAAYYYRALDYRHKDMYDQAAADFGQVIKLLPDDGHAYYERGLTYTYQSNYASALPDFTRATELMPTSADPYYQRGLTYTELTQYDNAIADFDKVLKLDPSYQDAYYRRGVAHAGKADYTNAVQDFTRAIELNPSNADTYYFARAETYRLL
ncbi:MAG: CHAT domain-containing protein, partial [Chloroflexia bacterium]